MGYPEFLTAELCEEIRAFLVPRWIAWGEKNGKLVTEKGEGMCRFTAAFLSELFPDEYVFSGGCPEVYDQDKGWVKSLNGGGFFDGSEWQSHHWVTNGRVIIDLTARQFGELGCIFDAEDQRFRNVMFFEHEIEEALRDVSDRASGWVGEYLSMRNENAVANTPR